MTRIALDTLGGLHLNVEWTGNGPPILAIHGFTGSVSTWDSFSMAAQDGYSIISLDLLGHGASDTPDNLKLYDMGHTVQALAELLDRLSIQRTHWLGYSLGGRIVLVAAIVLRDQTLSAILESASPGLPAAAERAARVRSDEALADMIEKDGIEAFISYWESLPLWASQTRLPWGVRQRLRAQRLTNSPVGLANSLRGIGAGAQPPPHHLLPKLSVPTLFIAGEEDTKFAAVAREMHRGVIGSHLRIVPESGHRVHLEQPGLFNRTVLEFLRTVEHSDTPGVQTRSRPSP